MVRRRTPSTRRKQSKRRSTRIRKMRGGGLKEDALKAIINSGSTAEKLLLKLLKNKETTEEIENYVYRSMGHVNLYLQAKNKGDDDSKYVDIFFMSDH